jgi:hypothetical protein
VHTVGAGVLVLVVVLVLPCTEQFHTVCRGFDDTDVLTFCCEFVNGLGTASTESSIFQTT